MIPKIKNIAVFASGSGSNFIAIYNQVKRGDINGRIKLLITNNSNAKAIRFAENNNIDYNVINKETILDSSAYKSYLMKILCEAKVDLIVLAGYLKIIPSDVIHAYKNKIINIHPSLLPKFGGKGFYGMKVHKAVIDSKEIYTGASVHFVDEIYDNGPIIMQEKIEVKPSDSPESISKKVLKIEHKILPYVVKKFCLGQIVFEENLPVIKGDFE